MKRTYIVLHHSLTQDGQVVDTQAIRRYHTSYRIDGVIVSPEEYWKRKGSGGGRSFEAPWSDIGYHFLVEQINNHWEILIGRDPRSVGAHCPHAAMNRMSYGICAIGNYDLAAPPNTLLLKLRGLTQWLMGEDGIATRNVVGHREAGLMEGLDWRKGQFKTCPGRLFDLEAFRLTL